MKGFGIIIGALFFLMGKAVCAGVPVIISTDVGNEIDDQWAIAYALTNPHFDVIGLTSAHAPHIAVPAAETSLLTLRDLVENKLAMNTHPPLIEGSSQKLPDGNTPIVSDAVKFIINASKSYSPSNRLNVVAIGAATDIASAIMVDPTIVDRIRVVAMAFHNPNNADEYNVINDLTAWQTLLKSRVPIVIGPGDTCKADLALNPQAAEKLLAGHGPVAKWLGEEYKAWYKGTVVGRGLTEWPIWDLIPFAYLENMAEHEVKPRPVLEDDLTLTHRDTPKASDTVTWITHVDSDSLWKNFTERLDVHQHSLEIQCLLAELGGKTDSHHPKPSDLSILPDPPLLERSAAPEGYGLYNLRTLFRPLQ